MARLSVNEPRSGTQMGMPLASARTVLSKSPPSVENGQSKYQGEARPSNRVMGEGLPDTKPPAVNTYSNEPIPDPLRVAYLGVLELGMTVGTEHEQVSRVVA